MLCKILSNILNTSYDVESNQKVKGIAHLPVTYKVQKNSWMDKDIFCNWSVHVFVPSVHQNSECKEIGEACKDKVHATSRQL